MIREGNKFWCSVIVELLANVGVILPKNQYLSHSEIIREVQHTFDFLMIITGFDVGFRRQCYNIFRQCGRTGHGLRLGRAGGLPLAAFGGKRSCTHFASRQSVVGRNVQQHPSSSTAGFAIEYLIKKQNEIIRNEKTALH